jgi:serine/threonine-protein kinase
MPGDQTVDSFPTYADLTQTQGWSRAAGSPIVGDEVTDLHVDPGAQRYMHGALLGTGGMGKVMLARDARIGREVAVKELHADRELAPEERARFLREARVQGQLEHPSIVPVYDIDQRPDGTTFFTMRRVLGRTLSAIIEAVRGGDPAACARYTQRELLTAFATVCLTIDYAHSRGVIHRDIKPANIMLGDFGEVYVLDWGLALVSESEHAPVDEPRQRLSMTGELLGTPLYMAPEQMADPSVGPAADVFSLGALLFELLTLQRLRDARTLYLPAEARPSVRAPYLDVPPELEAICVRATQTEPADRYPSVRALQEAIAGYLEGDRDTQARRELAAAHARTAREALARADEPGADYERERSVAINALLMTVKLDPNNQHYVTALAHFLQSRPRILPTAVTAQIVAGEQEVVRTASRLSIVAMVLWFACVPVVLAIGVRDVFWMFAILVPAFATLLLAVHASRRAYIPLWVQIGMVIGTLCGAVAISRMYGPLVLMPTLVATFTIVLQAHPLHRQRMVAFVAGAIALVAPVVLELVGVLPRSYAFEAGRMVIVPQMIELPELATSVFLTLLGLAMIFVPGTFIRRLRVSLSEAQVQLMLQSWHLEQLTVRSSISSRS